MIGSGDGGRGEEGHNFWGEAGNEAGGGAEPTGEVGLEGHLIDVAEGLAGTGLTGLVHDTCVFPEELCACLVEEASRALEPLLGVVGLRVCVSRDVFWEIS